MERLAVQFIKYRKLLRDAARCVLLHKLRSALSILGVVCGVAAVLTMIAIGEGAKHELIRRIEQLGTKNIYIRAMPMTAARAQQSFEKHSRGLTPFDRERIMAGCRYVKDIACIKEVRADVVGAEDEVAPQIIACSSNYADIFGLEPARGRFFKPEDISSHDLVCVVGDGIANRINAARNVGGDLRIGRHLFKVIGLLGRVEWNPEKNAVISSRNYNEMVFIPLGSELLFVDSASEKAGLHSNALSEMIIETEDSARVSEAAGIIKRILEVSHNGAEDYQVVIPRELLMEAAKTQRTFNLVLAAIGGISLLVGGIGVMNIMLASVSERTREIGIRRSVGATRQDIVMQFLVEAMFLTISGGIAGIVIGVMAVYLIASFASWPMIITPWALEVPLILSILVGIFFGLFPAMKASKMDPIAALRYE
jgi:putative ABC transport system permease protein